MQPTKTITLADGRNITIDLNKITLREWKNLFDPKQPDEDEDATFAKIAGISLDEYLLLGFADARTITSGVVRFAGEFTKDLNANPT